MHDLIPIVSVLHQSSTSLNPLVKKVYGTCMRCSQRNLVNYLTAAAAPVMLMMKGLQRIWPSQLNMIEVGILYISWDKNFFFLAVISTQRQPA